MSTSGGGGGRPEPWTPTETVALLDAYELLSLSSRRGQLRAWQWDEVAAVVAARVGRSPAAGAKTGTQCRHKIEKLRQRYRAESARQLPPHVAPAWPYFSRLDSLDRLERRRQPTQPAALPPPDSDNESESLPPPIPLRNPKTTFTNGGFKFDSVPRDSRSPRFFRKPTNEDDAYEDGEGDGHYDDVDDDVSDEEEDDESDNHDDDDDDLLSVVRGFGKNLMRLEMKKMEMIRQMERERMEMEQQRVQMVVNASRQFAEMIENAIATAANTSSPTTKKVKKS